MSDEQRAGIGPGPVEPGPDIDEQWERASAAFARVGHTPLLDLVMAVFAEQGVDYELVDPEVTIVRAEFDSDAGPIEVWVRTHEEHHTVAVRSTVPGQVPAEHIGTVLLLAARANRNVEVGSYELDPDGGPLTFKTAIDVEGGEFTVPLFRNLVGTAIVAADVMAPLLAQVLDGGDPVATGSLV